MNTDPVTKALRNNVNGVSLQGIAKEVRCEICNLSVSSYVVLRDHITGRKHKNQFRLICKSKNKPNLQCFVCNQLSANLKDWEVHVTSESHVERVKVYRPPATPVEISPYPPELHALETSNIPSLLPPEELKEIQEKFQEKLNKKAVQQILAKDKKEWNCNHCQITCQSLCSWEAHLASKKHRKSKHKFHTFPGISKQSVEKQYLSSFVRANETIRNEFIEDGVILYCKRCNVKMQTKLQLEIHMSSNQHKMMNQPIASMPVATQSTVQNNPQLFNFEHSSYGYGLRNWSGEQYIANANIQPVFRQCELQEKQEMEQQRQLVEEAKNQLLARFPFYAINLQNPPLRDQSQNDKLMVPDIPMPSEVSTMQNLGTFAPGNSSH